MCSRTKIVAVFLGLAMSASGCAVHPTVTRPAAVAPLGSRIEIGRDLFQPGSIRFGSATADLLKARLAEAKVATTGALRIEVFADHLPPIGDGRPGGKRKLSQQRAEALRDYLKSIGYKVTEAVGRGSDVVDHRPPDRRVEVVVLGA